VTRVMALSTDKAASPTNLYGATKLCAEKLFTQANSYVGQHPTRFASCRYGNVLGSRGSVVPAFLEQRQSGTLTITDDRMTRFWVSLPQAVEFVVRRTEEFRGGEVFVPKLPSVRMLDVAHALAPAAKLTVIGMRPGEKLHEVLVTQHEARTTRDRGEFLTIEPDHPWWRSDTDGPGERLPEDFEYRSDNNHEWLTNDDVCRLLRDLVTVPADEHATSKASG